ncbi:MAG: hypothetical protein LBR68_03740 [Lachnoclostridium sp.]|jgi:hypothetical protein|nr:hypothetical protein [Lachnoclostridium sp.]
MERSDLRTYTMQKRLSEIRSAISVEEKSQIRIAGFVATTISKAVIDKALYSQEFDVVIFDEASMAYIPQVIFAASLAKKYFICIGDFKQLSPIVASEKESLLNNDIFKYCGISAAVENNFGHNWLCLLDTQHRMHPDISDFVSSHMYEGLLKSSDDMNNERSPIKVGNPLPNAAMGIADLSGMMSVCTKTNTRSRFNVLSAFISCGLAMNSKNNYSVGIISPYKAQSRLIHAMLRDLGTKYNALKSITSATVHQFQGSEKDIIIYDAVECYRMKYPGTLFTSKKNNLSDRLFNVALTRAKGKFISVVNVDYMDAKNMNSGYLFGNMLRHIKITGNIVNGQECINEIKLSTNEIYGVMSGHEADNVFFADIYNAKKEVRIDIPGFIDNDDFVFLLGETIDEVKKKGIKVYIRAEKKNDLPDPIKRLAIQNSFVVNPVVLIDRQIVWFGMPHSLDEFNQIILPLKHFIVQFFVLPA